MTTLPLQFSFKGARDYVHGTDIYQAIADFVAREYCGPVARMRLGIHRYFRTQADLLWAQGARPGGRPEGAVAEFSVEGTSQAPYGWLVETRREVTRRIADDEEGITRRCVLLDRAVSVREETGRSPIEVVVAMTKHLHRAVFPGAVGHWSFTRLDLRGLLRPEEASGITIALKEDLSGRFTKSEIRTAQTLKGHIYFSLAKR